MSYFFLVSIRRQTRCALVTGLQTCARPISGDFEQRRPPAEDRRVRPMHAILGRGWIEGAERDIIGPRLPCLHREVAAVMACHADLRRRPKQTARLARVAVALPQMHAIRAKLVRQVHPRSEEHTSELQSLMRISYAVFCLKKKTLNYQRV